MTSIRIFISTVGIDATEDGPRFMFGVMELLSGISPLIVMRCIMGGLLLITVFMLLQGSIFIRLFVNVTEIPLSVLLPCIMILCTFTYSQSIFRYLTYLLC